jgi:hypothetical protein
VLNDDGSCVRGAAVAGRQKCMSRGAVEEELKLTIKYELVNKFHPQI